VAKKSSKSKLLHVSFQDPHLTAVKKLAEKWACSVSAAIRRAVLETAEKS
jgi:hypothetical protein